MSVAQLHERASARRAACECVAHSAARALARGRIRHRLQRALRRRTGSGWLSRRCGSSGVPGVHDRDLYRSCCRAGSRRRSTHPHPPYPGGRGAGAPGRSLDRRVERLCPDGRTRIARRRRIELDPQLGRAVPNGVDLLGEERPGTDLPGDRARRRRGPGAPARAGQAGRSRRRGAR